MIVGVGLSLSACGGPNSGMPAPVYGPPAHTEQGGGPATVYGPPPVDEHSGDHHGEIAGEDALVDRDAGPLAVPAYAPPPPHPH